jgi:hypothetical protein
LAKTIKYWHPDAQICLLTNNDVGPDSLFDYVHAFPFPLNEQNPYANDWQVFHATPFRETIKLEADMMITSPIDYWWTQLRHRDIVGKHRRKRLERSTCDSTSLQKSV